MPLKQFVKKYKRQLMTAAALAAAVYVFTAIGIFSYYQSKDSVTNRITSKNGSVTLYEPLWDSKGQQMAQKSEPGMVIEKAPYAMNNGEVDLYIRLKVTIDLVESSTVSAAERFAAIIDKIQYKTTNNNVVDYTPFLTQNGTTWSCSNEYYAIHPNTVSIPDSPTMELYFYYTNGDAAKHMCRVCPGQSTQELFHQIEIPIYKNDYLGIFDKNYDIKVEAQALPADDFEEVPTVTDTNFLEKWPD